MPVSSVIFHSARKCLALFAGAAQAATMEQGLKSFKPFIVEHIGIAIAGTKKLQTAVKAGDVKAAQAAWIESRKGWEAMETVTGTYFGDIDKEVDAWPDAKKGYHAIEVVLFKAGKTEGLEAPIAAVLVSLDKFEKRAKSKSFKITAQKLLEGAANLAYEVGEEKSKGGESPYAGTSIVDMQENVESIEMAYKLVFSDTLKKKDAKLAGIVDERILNLERLVKVDDIKSMDQKKVHIAGEELAALLLTAAPKLGLKEFKVGDEEEGEKDKAK
ncbi:MAG TPA: EfeM/EfeO family lipoprotein [Pseudolabrys sp.]